jgi:hypothetical protein
MNKLKGAILTHNWDSKRGWIKTNHATVNDFEDIVHFGTNVEGEIFIALAPWDGKSIVYKGFFEPIDVRIVRRGKKINKSTK